MKKQGKKQYRRLGKEFISSTKEFISSTLAPIFWWVVALPGGLVLLTCTGIYEKLTGRIIFGPKVIAPFLYLSIGLTMLFYLLIGLAVANFLT